MSSWYRGVSAYDSKFVRGVRAQKEFKLQPDGMVHAHIIPVVVIVLQPEFGKLARIKRQRGRDAPALVALWRMTQRIVVTRHEVAPQRSHPARAEAPRHLRVNPPVIQGLAG